MADIDKKIAEFLWDNLDIEIKRFHPKLKIHDKSDFLGYADVEFSAPGVLPGFIFQVRGIEVKLLKGNDRIDMPQEKGGDNKWYPRYFPKTGELRAVMTTAVFLNDGVQSAVKQIGIMKTEANAAGTSEGTPASATGGDNPFKTDTTEETVAATA